MGAKLQNWFNTNIWDVSKSSVGPTYDLKGTIHRSQIFGFDDNFAQEPVTERRSHGIATVYACINVRAQTIGALPGNVFRETENGDKESLPDHPSYYPLAQQPNNYMSSANMFLSSMIKSDSWGNSFIGINRNGRGAVSSLDPLMPEDCTEVKIIDGKAYYKIRGDVVPGRDVLHFRWWSYDGVNGISPIRQNMMTMGKAIKQEKYSTYALGQKPPGILYYEGVQGAEQKAENQKSWTQDLQTGKTPILSGRWKFDPIILSPDEAQYIETEGLTDKKICSIFRVPPVFIQDFQRATFTNAEQSDLIFVKHTIVPIVRVMEQEINMKMFSEREKKNTYYKFNLNGLLRGDTAARAAFYKTMRDVGGMNGNQIREREDMNQYDGGEEYTVQSANCPVDLLRDFYESKVEPTAPQPIKSKMNGHEILN